MSDLADGRYVAELELALLSLDQVAAESVLIRAGEGRSRTEVLDELVSPTLVRIGERWEIGEVALSQVFLGGRMCERLISARLDDDPPARGAAPRLAIGVLDDAHVLGKQIVVQMLRSSGHQVSDWGARLSVDDMVAGVLREEIEVLLISVLMLRSALQVGKVRSELNRLGANPVVVVGGAPFRLDPGLGGEVGADYVGRSASDILPILAKISTSR